VRETALNFGPGGRLVGVLTRPDASPSGAGEHPAVVFLNAGILHRIGPNRIHVRMARKLAQRGVASLRLDFPGVGDSRTLGTGLSLVEEGQESVRAALTHLADHGVADRFVVFGLCSGADAAFRTACVDSRVVGITLVDPTRLFPTRKTWILRGIRAALRLGPWGRLLTGRYNLLRRLADRFRPVPPNTAGGASAESGEDPERDGSAGRLTHQARELASQALAGLIERDIRICHIITGDQWELYNYRTQLLDAFPELDLEPVTRLELFRDAHHTFRREADRRVLEETLIDWVTGERFTEPGQPEVIT